MYDDVKWLADLMLGICGIGILERTWQHHDSAHCAAGPLLAGFPGIILTRMKIHPLVIQAASLSLPGVRPACTPLSPLRENGVGVGDSRVCWASGLPRVDRGQAPPQVVVRFGSESVRLTYPLKPSTRGVLARRTC
eukprot:6214107-Pleurochrysis_carterae.AAC.4